MKLPDMFPPKVHVAFVKKSSEIIFAETNLARLRKFMRQQFGKGEWTIRSYERTPK